MFRLAIRFLVFSTVLAIGFYSVVQWRAVEELNLLKQQWHSDIEFQFESAKIYPNGNLVINDVSLFFVKQGISVSIEQIEYSVGSLMEVVFLSDHIKIGQLPDDVRVVLNKVVIPLTPLLVKFLSQTDENNTWKSLQASACGSKNKIGMSEYFSMGYDNLVFSSVTEFAKNIYNGSYAGKGWLDIEETSRLDYRFGLLLEQSNKIPTVNTLKTASITSLNLSLKDTGYNRHRNEYCSLKSESSTEVFLTEHIKTVRQRLNSVGIKLTLAGERAYKQMLEEESLLEISVSPSASFSFNDFGYYDEKELRGLLNLNVQINDSTIHHIFDGWALDKFNKISIRKKQGIVQDAAQQRFETIVVKRNYHQESLRDLDRFLDYKVKVEQKNGSITTGKLRKLAKGKMFLDIALQGGVIQKTIRIDGIEKFFVYR